VTRRRLVRFAGGAAIWLALVLVASQLFERVMSYSAAISAWQDREGYEQLLERTERLYRVSACALVATELAGALATLLLLGALKGMRLSEGTPSQRLALFVLCLIAFAGLTVLVMAALYGRVRWFRA
jgi:hypothetical protein